MGWASEYIALLQNGQTVQFRPRGNSMKGKIESGQLCTVEPVVPATLEVGDIVLCNVNGKQYLHLVKAIQGKRFQIGNNRGRINGWVGENVSSANAPMSSDAPWHERATVLAFFVNLNGGVWSAKAVVAAARASRPEASKSDRVMPRRYTGRSG